MGRLKSFFYTGFLLIELLLLIIFKLFLIEGYISTNLYKIIAIIIILLLIYRVICFILDIGIAKRINDYFVFLNLPYINLVFIHQKAKKGAIKNISCKEKIRKLINTPNDFIPKLKENKTYITFTHEKVASRIEDIKGIKIITKKPAFSQSLNKIQEQIYQCKKIKCEKFNNCIYIDNKIESFYFIKFKYKPNNQNIT